MVPATEDPWYSLQDLPSVDPLAEIFAANPCAYQTIRALPCPKGCAWHFSHKIIHWGSFAKSTTIQHEKLQPRIAMSWVVGNANFEKPCFDLSNLPYPSLTIRIAFIAGQIIAYGGQTGLKRGFKNLMYRVFKRHSKQLGVDFADKVEFINFCRPPPAAGDIPIKEKPVIDIDKLEFATAEEDEQNLHGMKGIFGCDENSSSDEE